MIRARTEKQEKQALDNLFCIDVMNSAMEQAQKEQPKAKKFRTCKAVTFETTDFIILKSYSHCVAIYDKRNKLGVDVLRYTYGYTATSAQHIAKFFSDMAFFNGMSWRSNLAITRYYDV